MGLYEMFFGDEKSKEQEEFDELEDEMDDLGLDDWEKDEVRNNGWNPEDFGDDELEEDDYYFDDD